MRGDLSIRGNRSNPSVSGRPPPPPRGLHSPVPWSGGEAPGRPLGGAGGGGASTGIHPCGWRSHSEPGKPRGPLSTAHCFSESVAKVPARREGTSQGDAPPPPILRLFRVPDSKVVHVRPGGLIERISQTPLAGRTHGKPEPVPVGPTPKHPFCSEQKHFPGKSILIPLRDLKGTGSPGVTALEPQLLSAVATDVLVKLPN